MVNKPQETKLTVKMLGVIAGILVTILGAFASMCVFIDGRYVNEDVYDIHVTQNEEDKLKMDEKTAQIIGRMQYDSEQAMSRV